MQIAIGKSITDIHWQNKEVSWERFCKLLEKPIHTPETVSEYQNPEIPHQGYRRICWRLSDKGGAPEIR